MSRIKTITRWNFIGKDQIPLVMKITSDFDNNGNVIYASVDWSFPSDKIYLSKPWLWIGSKLFGWVYDPLEN